MYRIMTPKQKYQQEVDRQKWISDPAQQVAIEHLEHLYQRLMTPLPKSRYPLLDRLKKKWQLDSERTSIKGLYLVGGVGRGKTHLMDLFYDLLPIERKGRFHFYRFMNHVHEQMHFHRNKVDPLAIVAHQLSSDLRVLCFDEFFVSDITDAMILGRLIQLLFDQGVVLVATSNLYPNELYRNGLQRERFIPAIHSLEAHCDVIELNGEVDHRLRHLTQAPCYYFPLTKDVKVQFSERFFSLVGEESSASTMLKVVEIHHRTLPVEQQSHDVVHFSFSILCQTARSARDYIEIAKIYHTVFISDIKVMTSDHEDVARRFITMVDEFYERNVKLLMTGEVALSSLYQGNLLAFEFERCLSRLVEMQSHHYLSKKHQR